jgi:hypothetical protein
VKYFRFLVFVQETERRNVHLTLVVWGSPVQAAYKRPDRVDGTPFRYQIGTGGAFCFPDRHLMLPEKHFDAFILNLRSRGHTKVFAAFVAAGCTDEVWNQFVEIDNPHNRQGLSFFCNLFLPNKPGALPPVASPPLRGWSLTREMGQNFKKKSTPKSSRPQSIRAGV